MFLIDSTTLLPVYRYVTKMRNGMVLKSVLKKVCKNNFQNNKPLLVSKNPKRFFNLVEHH